MTFETMEDFEEYCDTSMFCVCGQLMTGLHMSGCRKLRKERERLEEKLGKDVTNRTKWLMGASSAKV
jgi:hypothetical protein